MVSKLKKTEAFALNASDVSVKEKTSLSDGFLKLNAYTLTHKRFDGGEMTVRRELLERGVAVAVLLFDPLRDTVVLVEQFRIGALEHPRSPWLLELVAGIAEPGETLEDVARREAEEESGAILLSLEHVLSFMVSPGGVKETIDIFCAQVDSSQMGGEHGLASEGEDIRVHIFDRQQAIGMVSEGLIDNASTIIALQWLALNHQRLITQADVPTT